MTIDEATTAARGATGPDSPLERIVNRLGRRAGVEAVFDSYPSPGVLLAAAVATAIVLPGLARLRG